MQDSKVIPVIGTDGPIGVVVQEAEALPGHKSVRLANGRSVLVPTSVLLEQGDGSYHLPMTGDEFQRAAGSSAQAEDSNNELKRQSDGRT